MKKSLILACLTASVLSSVAMDANAAAVTVCAGGTGGTVAVSSSTSGFIKSNFTAQCSANVVSLYIDTSTAMGVAAGSKKGKNVFAGGTNGGSVKNVATCATSGCSTAEVTEAVATTAMNGS